MRKIMMAAVAASMATMPAQAMQRADNKTHDALANVQASCRTMMNGWEQSNAIDQPATITATVQNSSNMRMVVLAKRKDGKFWSVADLAPGASRTIRVNEGTNFAWARHGGNHDCRKSFSLANNTTNTFS